MYNNPYNFYPYMNSMTPNMGNMALQNAVRPRGGLFKSISNIKWSTVLNNTQKTLNVINQAIPVYYQIKPIVGNIKSFGKLMAAFNSDDNMENDEVNITKTNNQNNSTIKKENSNNSPTFFIN